MPWARMQMSNDGGRSWSDLEDPLHKMAEVEYEDASTDLTAPFRRAVENVIVQVGDSFRIRGRDDWVRDGAGRRRLAVIG